MTRNEIKKAFPTAQRIVMNPKNWLVYFGSETEMVKASKVIKFNHTPVFSGNYIMIAA